MFSDRDGRPPSLIEALAALAAIVNMSLIVIFVWDLLLPPPDPVGAGSIRILVIAIGTLAGAFFAGMSEGSARRWLLVATIAPGVAFVLGFVGTEITVATMRARASCGFQIDNRSAKPIWVGDVTVSRFGDEVDSESKTGWYGIGYLPRGEDSIEVEWNYGAFVRDAGKRRRTTVKIRGEPNKLRDFVLVFLEDETWTAHWDGYEGDD